MTYQSLEELIDSAGYNLRSISLHSDGRWIAKSGANAKYPKRLYNGRTAKQAVTKLLLDQRIMKKISKNKIDFHELNEIKKECGLAYGGKNDESEELWIGTEHQWNNYQRCMDELDQMTDEDLRERFPVKNKTLENLTVEDIPF